MFKIQVLNENNAVVYDGILPIPREVPYSPDQTVGSPLTLAGLKTAIDYAYNLTQTGEVVNHLHETLEHLKQVEKK